jgi:transcriptional regulator with XRE-family HTH domain
MTPVRVRSVEHAVLGRSVRELRGRFHLSQERVGLGGGLHRNYDGAIERGEINPTFAVLLKLADGLTVPLSELFALYERRRAELR